MSSDIRPANSANAPRPKAPRRIVVTVRHSPFPLKRAVVQAETDEEAKAKFIELARAENERKCKLVEDHQEPGEMHKALRARRESFQRAIDADKRDELVWTFVEESEYKAQREKIKSRLARVWGDAERMAV